jgi:hypothetical protein
MVRVYPTYLAVQPQAPYYSGISFELHGSASCCKTVAATSSVGSCNAGPTLNPNGVPKMEPCPFSSYTVTFRIYFVDREVSFYPSHDYSRKRSQTQMNEAWMIFQRVKRRWKPLVTSACRMLTWVAG